MTDGEAEIRDLLTRTRTIAIVGLSDKPERDSNEVARYLKSQGYRILPINPMLTEVLGEKAYPSLTALPPGTKVDIVDIFRRSDQVAPVVDEALAIGAGAIWMQLGVSTAEAAAKAELRGVPVLQDLCHHRFGDPRAIQ